MMGKRIAFACLFIIHVVEVSRHIGIVGRVRVLGFHVLDTGISYLSELIPQVSGNLRIALVIGIGKHKKRFSDTLHLGVAQFSRLVAPVGIVVSTSQSNSLLGEWGGLASVVIGEDSHKIGGEVRTRLVLYGCGSSIGLIY